jgi:hypothetical protein
MNKLIAPRVAQAVAAERSKHRCMTDGVVSLDVHQSQVAAAVAAERERCRQIGLDRRTFWVERFNYEKATACRDVERIINGERPFDSGSEELENVAATEKRHIDNVAMISSERDEAINELRKERERHDAELSALQKGPWILTADHKAELAKVEQVAANAMDMHKAELAKEINNWEVNREIERKHDREAHRADLTAEIARQSQAMREAVAEAVEAVTKERDEARGVATRQRNAVQEAVKAEREKGNGRIPGLIVRIAHTLGMTSLTDEQVKSLGIDDAISIMALASRERRSELAQEKEKTRQWSLNNEGLRTEIDELVSKRDEVIRGADQRWQERLKAVEASVYERVAKRMDAKAEECQGLHASVKRFQALAREFRQLAAKPKEPVPSVGEFECGCSGTDSRCPMHGDSRVEAHDPPSKGHVGLFVKDACWRVP